MVSSHGDFSMLMLVFCLAVVAGASRQSGKLFPCSSRRLGTNLSRFSSSQGKGIRCAISSSSKNNGGIAEISESELAKHFYAWPDYKVSVQCATYIKQSCLFILKVLNLSWCNFYFCIISRKISAHDNNMLCCNSVLFKNFVLSTI